MTIIGLYSNVSSGGVIEAAQTEWLVRELGAAADDCAVVVALHHPVYSVDSTHGGSSALGGALDSVFRRARRVPDLVVSGHAHNYQRFARQVAGKVVPYIVAGAGGYWRLHPLARDVARNALQVPWDTGIGGLTLESAVADRHGYLILRAEPGRLSGEYITVPRSHESWTKGPRCIADRFSVAR